MPLYNPVVNRVLEIREIDGSPNVSDVTIIEVSNGTLADDGGGQVTITTGGGGGLETVLSDTTLGVDGTFDVSSISGAYTHLRLLLHARSDAVATEDAIIMSFNNDTTNGNYLYAYMFSGNGGVSGGTVANRTVGFSPAASSPANRFGDYIIDIPLYAGSNLKNSIINGYSPDDTSENYTLQYSRVWLSTSIIDRITIVPGSGTNFKADSRLTIIGIAI